MGNQASSLGDWQAVIAAHPLESHDPQAWLQYGVALLQTIQPGLDAAKQQQQAALAFVQAQKEGAPADLVSKAQGQAASISLAQALLLAGFREQGLRLLEQQLPLSMNTEERPARARVLAGQLLVKAGAWKEAESLHAEALRSIDLAQLAPDSPMSSALP
jgi:hypothetical protein